MGIAEQLKERTMYIVVGQCKTCEALTKMDKADAYATVDALNDSKVSHTVVAGVLTRNGHPVSEASIRRHRRNHKVT